MGRKGSGGGVSTPGSEVEETVRGNRGGGVEQGRASSGVSEKGVGPWGAGGGEGEERRKSGDEREPPTFNFALSPILSPQMRTHRQNWGKNQMHIY